MPAKSTIDDASAPEGDRVRLIDRSFDVLEAVADMPRTLSEVQKQTGLSKATVYRLLAGLRARDLVFKDPVSGSYMLAPGALRLVSSAVSGLAASTSIASMGRMHLEELAERTQETVALHVRTGLARVCIFEVPGPQPIRFSATVGLSAPLTIGAGGRVLLAFQGKAERDRLLPLLDIGDRHEFELKIADVAERGFAISVAERVEGASAIAVPIVAARSVIALSVLGPTARLPDPVLNGFTPIMRDAAAKMASELTNR